MLYRRYAFDLFNNEKGFIRVREENNKITMTIKNILTYLNLPMNMKLK